MSLKRSILANRYKMYDFFNCVHTTQQAIFSQSITEHNITIYFFVLDQYIGNMVKASVVLGMQQYLGDALVKCNVSRKIGNTPIFVSIFTNCFRKMCTTKVVNYCVVCFYAVQYTDLWFSRHNFHPLRLSSYIMLVSTTRYTFANII